MSDCVKLNLFKNLQSNNFSTKMVHCIWFIRWSNQNRNNFTTQSITIQPIKLKEFSLFRRCQIIKLHLILELVDEHTIKKKMIENSKEKMTWNAIWTDKKIEIYLPVVIIYLSTHVCICIEISIAETEMCIKFYLVTSAHVQHMMDIFVCVCVVF